VLAPLGGRFGEEDMIGPLARHFEPRLPLLRALQRVDLATFCADSILPKVDRASMAHSLEVRVPFLDRRLVEHVLALPVVPGEEPKALLRQLLDERVPAAVLTGPKRGFSLRTLGSFDWESARRRVREGPWVRGGLFSPAWERCAAPDVPGWQGRLFGLWLLDAWGRGWLDGSSGPLDSDATRSDCSA
jgi:asparagine synthase (glutamine-hydrolysing)